jgi:hypothetical protein
VRAAGQLGVVVALLGLASGGLAQELAPPWSTSTATPPALAATAGPGATVVATAERMIADGTVVRGSCYDYVSAVFEAAGYPRERREHVFRSRTEGPYADLGDVRPGDWLAIVNHPERDPVGTHSVIFVRWNDRARGEAEVVSYAGGDQDRPGEIVIYDLTRTYRITRPVDAPSE